MKNINRFNLSVCFLFAAVLFAGLLYSQAVFADDDNVGGFAWSGQQNEPENGGLPIGWISFNKKSMDDGLGNTLPGGGGNVNFGVDIEDNASSSEYGWMRGYAWAGAGEAGGGKEGMGWISFNGADAVGCGGCATAEACQAKAATAPDGEGNHPLSGWARVVSVKNEPSNSGGWDGCIYLGGTPNNLKGVYIDINGDFHGYAWTDMVMGWISFNGTAVDGSIYKVHTTAKFIPVAVMECDKSGCAGGSCEGEVWKAYQQTGTICSDCFFRILNKSVGNVKCSNWKLAGTGYSHTFSGGSAKNALTLGTDTPLGTYDLVLTVSDKYDGNADCTSGNHTEATHQINIRSEVATDMRCTFDDPNSTSTAPLWQDCSSSDFKKKIVNGEKLYMKDESAFSEGGSAIVGKKWLVNGEELVADASSTVSFTTAKNNSMRLDVVDDNPDASKDYSGRHNCDIVDVRSKSLPEWKEISAVENIWQYLVKGVAMLFSAL